MKYIISLVMALCLPILILAQDSNNPNLKVETRFMGPFNSVRAAKGINVTLIPGDKESIEIRVENGITEDVITQLEGKTLVLKMKTKIYKGMKMMAYVTYLQIDELVAGSGSSIESEEDIKTAQLKLNAATDAVIDIKIDVDKVDAYLVASQIILSGKATHQSVNANTAARYNSEDLQGTDANVKVTTGATATLKISNKLVATAGSGGKVYYFGEPKQIEKTETLGGKVESIK
jgi:hypothetical protein